MKRRSKFLPERGRENLFEWPRISFHPLFFLPFVLLFFFNSPRSILFLLGAALWHEAGHFLAISLTHNRAKRILLCPMGAQIELEKKLCGYREDFAVFLAGPLFNFLFCAVLLFFIRREPSRDLIFFFGCHFLLGAFNLLPLSGLDGGRALFSLLCFAWDPLCAGKFVRLCGLLFLCVIFCLSLFLLWKTGGNFSLLLMDLFLAGEFFLARD